jgi:aryl-alcohol dehydrogenase-like predicted oxidoreductase
LKPDLTDADRIEKVKKLALLAAGLGISMAQLALAWCLKNPQVSTVIMGASRVAQVHENLKALEAVEKLTPEIMAAIETILGNRPEEDD